MSGLASPSFSALIGDGAAITIKGQVQGADHGQVEFAAVQKIGGARQPRFLHVEKFRSGLFELEAPAELDQPLYVSAIAYEEDEMPGPSHEMGFLAGPLLLTGEDLEIVIVIGNNLQAFDGVFDKPTSDATPPTDPPDGALGPPPSQPPRAPPGGDGANPTKPAGQGAPSPPKSAPAGPASNPGEAASSPDDS